MYGRNGSLLGETSHPQRDSDPCRHLERVGEFNLDRYECSDERTFLIAKNIANLALGIQRALTTSVSIVKHAFIACLDRTAMTSMHLYRDEDRSSAMNILTASTASFAKTSSSRSGCSPFMVLA